MRKSVYILTFLCAKYGPKVNTISTEYDKSSAVIPFRDVRFSLLH